jgi:type I site-specific restriction endonuclease
MSSEADTRANYIDPALVAAGWTSHIETTQLTAKIDLFNQLRASVLRCRVARLPMKNP